MKDPETGKRISRLNPEADWIIQDVPELRIVDDDLWQATKARQEEKKADWNTGDLAFWDRKRPRYLFSGLMSCGCCGGGIVNLNTVRVGCANARNKGTCDNHRTMRRDALEATILDALKSHLMDPDLFALFCDEYTRHMNALRIDATASLAGYKAELAKATKDIERLIDAITDGAAVAQLARFAQGEELLHACEIVVPLAGLLPEPLRRDVPHGAGHVGVVIALIAAPVGKMDCDIGDHALRDEHLRHELADERQALPRCELVRQWQHEFPRDLGVLAAAGQLDIGPELLAVIHPVRSAGGCEDLGVDDARFAGVVETLAGALVKQEGRRPVGGNRRQPSRSCLRRTASTIRPATNASNCRSVSRDCSRHQAHSSPGFSGSLCAQSARAASRIARPATSSGSAHGAVQRRCIDAKVEAAFDRMRP